MSHLKIFAMGRTKSIAAQTTKGKRVRIESPKPPTRSRVWKQRKVEKVGKYKELDFYSKENSIIAT